MPSFAASAAALDRDRLLQLELELIRIPGSAFAEHVIADFLADHMKGLGLEVEMMAVEDRKRPGHQSRQPVGRLRLMRTNGAADR